MQEAVLTSDCAVLEALAAATGDHDERDRRQEERRFADQRRRAEEEKSRRAREALERRRQQEVEEARRREGRCVLCGSALSAVARRLGSVKHRTCREFVDET